MDTRPEQRQADSQGRRAAAMNMHAARWEGPATSFGMGLKARLLVTCPEPLRLPQGGATSASGACVRRAAPCCAERTSWPAAQQNAHLLPMLGS